MIKRFYSILIIGAVVFTALSSSVSAQERPKASVAVIFINNAKTSYDDELNTKINSWLHSKVDGIYNVLPAEPFISKMSALGQNSIIEDERDELCSFFSDKNIDYAVVAELQPFLRKERITVFTYGKDMTATMYLKIIDLRNKQYLYNGKFIVKGSDTTTSWFIGNKSVAFMAIDSVLVQMGEVISFRLPLQPPIVKKDIQNL